MIPPGCMGKTSGNVCMLALQQHVQWFIEIESQCPRQNIAFCNYWHNMFNRWDEKTNLLTSTSHF